MKKKLSKKIQKIITFFLRNSSATRIKPKNSKGVRYARTTLFLLKPQRGTFGFKKPLKILGQAHGSNPRKLIPS